MNSTTKVLYDALVKIAGQSRILTPEMELYDQNIEEARRAIDRFADLNAKNMKVFKMNDCDWVTHRSEEQAKEYYKELTGMSTEDLEEFYEGEVPLTDKMHWEAIEVDRLDSSHNFERVKDSPFGDCYLITFEWAIKHRPELYPGIISTTEC